MHGIFSVVGESSSDGNYVDLRCVALLVSCSGLCGLDQASSAVLNFHFTKHIQKELFVADIKYAYFIPLMALCSFKTKD